MTKSDEIELLKRFVEKMPRAGYVVPFLRHLIPQFEQNARSDLDTFPDIRELEQQVYDSQRQMSELDLARRAAEARVKDLQTHIVSLEVKRNAVREDIRRLRDNLDRTLA